VRRRQHELEARDFVRAEIELAVEPDIGLDPLQQVGHMSHLASW
jgi:hypothetical protein